MRVSLGASAFVLLAVTGALAGARPRDFVDAATVVPGLVLDMRYPTANNFVGRPIAGYRAAKCLLTKRTANALKEVAG